MKTPIVDYVRQYNESDTVRAHMPGHKGTAFLGFEGLDITEIKGADYLYFADGIIEESEENATKLFDTGRTVYSTEGSSQCIKAMLYLALLNHKKKGSSKRPYILAARNAHASFIHALALLDLDVKWLWPENGAENVWGNEKDAERCRTNISSICNCIVSGQQLEVTLNSLSEPPAAVFVTSPDYLGGVMDIEVLSKVCHKHGTILLVDNAHGAYLNFLDSTRYSKYKHPIQCGADICCDSAHKTLPVLTGGAYLHISKALTDEAECVKYALALFGSTSPSYLILQSLDLCNRYLADGYKEKLSECCKRMENLKFKLSDMGYGIIDSDPLRLTVRLYSDYESEERVTLSGNELADLLRKEGVECEYSDDEFVVMMLTDCNKDEDFERILSALEVIKVRDIQGTGKNCLLSGSDSVKDEDSCFCDAKGTKGKRHPSEAAAVGMSVTDPFDSELKNVKAVMTVRNAVFALHERVPVEKALGRICAAPAIACPPAISIAVPGERIDEVLIRNFKRYHIESVEVVKKNESKAKVVKVLC